MDEKFSVSVSMANLIFESCTSTIWLEYAVLLGRRVRFGTCNLDAYAFTTFSIFCHGAGFEANCNFLSCYLLNNYK
ncbi:hypothetical protein SUGI_0025830 [Cryptomeria japonica]|nr:hypothetical protein SUGI_0025830 [Cryptomeria japonica]